ncbi:sulfatase-like hydrolase/transferase, partial [bacterium]|nr:sulfatase-like hydrolase/transferase [bacterium]
MRRILFVVAVIILAIGAAIYFRKRPSEITPSNPVVQKPNVLLITIDTLRPDRLGAYGYQKIQTPVLDRLAQTGILFRDAVCQTPLTL